MNSPTKLKNSEINLELTFERLEMIFEGRLVTQENKDFQGKYDHCLDLDINCVLAEQIGKTYTLTEEGKAALFLSYHINDREVTAAAIKKYLELKAKYSERDEEFYIRGVKTVKPSEDPEASTMNNLLLKLRKTFEDRAQFASFPDELIGGQPIDYNSQDVIVLDGDDSLWLGYMEEGKAVLSEEGVVALELAQKIDPNSVTKYAVWEVLASIAKQA